MESLVTATSMTEPEGVGFQVPREPFATLTLMALVTATGTVLVPAFSIGRTQELLYELEEIIHRNREKPAAKGLNWGEVDVVVGNWLQPPAELHLGRLVSDEIVCLVAEDHPAARMTARAWTPERYLECQHVAPTPLHGNTPGVIDEHLASLGLRRDVVVKSAHFSLFPLMVAGSLLVLTTGRLFCSRYVDSLPVRIVRCPIAFPSLTYYQLWHDLTHASTSMRWWPISGSSRRRRSRMGCDVS